MLLHKTLFLLGYLRLVSPSKLYSGQKVYVDVQIIDFADPGKHGFHIVLNEEFVNTHLQPIRLPTVFATAIAVKHPEWRQNLKNESSPVVTRAPATSAASLNDGLRVTKILYPENVNPEDGLLDGRTIKLLGLRERTWYYVCVEFESNLNRHELATGASCQLKRTLDKFGKTTDSIISEIELSEVTDRSIAVKLRLEIDFPLRLSLYLDQEQDNSASVPAQTFIVDQSRTINVQFPFLDPDTKYGRVCVVEEPLALPSGAYTATGRAIRANMNHCYFDGLKTNAAPQQLNSQERQQLKSPEKSNFVQSGRRIFVRPNKANAFTALSALILFSIILATAI